MTIDKEKLISLLIDRTGSEREHVESQLTELVSRIQKAAEEGKSFEIEGFGTFSVKNDQLEFMPSDILQTEINNKYAGMKPIELIGAFKEADINAKEIDDEETPLAWEDPTAGIEKGQGAEDEGRSWAFDQASASEQERIEKAIFGDSFADNPDVVEGSESSSEVFELQKTEEETVEVQQNEAPVTQKPNDENNKIGKVLMAVTVILVIGVAGWLIYDAGLFAASNTMNRQSSLQNQPKEKVAEINMVTSSKPASRVEGKDLESEADKMPEPERQVKVPSKVLPDNQQGPYGLQGNLDSSVSTGYTIVVHSLKSLEKAKSIKKILQSNDFRVMIMEAMVNGSKYFRVGLGQFQTVEAAQKAVDQLPEKFKNNNFIKRF